MRAAREIVARLLPALPLLALLACIAGCGGESATKKPAEVSPQDKQQMAFSMLNAGRVGDALRLIDEALAEEPDNVRFLSAKGEICMNAGRITEAESAFLRVLEIDPYMTDAHNALGSIYDQLGRKTEAEKQFKTALADRAYPTPEKVHLNLGLLYSSQGRTDEAIDALRSAVSINPKYYRGHYELASILDRVGKIEEAASEYEVAAPDFAGQGEYHYRLGYAYYRLGRKDQARGSLERAIALAPGSNNAVRADELLKLLD